MGFRGGGETVASRWESIFIVVIGKVLEWTGRGLDSGRRRQVIYSNAE